MASGKKCHWEFFSLLSVFWKKIDQVTTGLQYQWSSPSQTMTHFSQVVTYNGNNDSICINRWWQCNNHQLWTVIYKITFRHCNICRQINGQVQDLHMPVMPHNMGWRRICYWLFMCLYMLNTYITTHVFQYFHLLYQVIVVSCYMEDTELCFFLVVVCFYWRINAWIELEGLIET